MQDVSKAMSLIHTKKSIYPIVDALEKSLVNNLSSRKIYTIMNCIEYSRSNKYLDIKIKIINPTTTPTYVSGHKNTKSEHPT